MKKRMTIFAAWILVAGTAGAWTWELKGACEAIANGTATPQQEALAFANNNVVNNMALNGQLSDSVYQATQTHYAEQSQAFAQEACAENGATMNVQVSKNQHYKPGTDSDYITDATSVKQTAGIKESYNQKVNNYLKQNNVKTGKTDWTKKNDVDFMPDAKNVSAENFAAQNTLNNDAYTRPGAARFEADSRATDPATGEVPPPNIADSGEYVEEMGDFIGKKAGKGKAQLDAAVEAAKNPASQQAGTKAYETTQNLNAGVHKTNAQQAKYIDRINETTARIAEANDVKPPEVKTPKPPGERPSLPRGKGSPKPGSKVSPETTRPSSVPEGPPPLEVSGVPKAGAARLPGTQAQAATANALGEHLYQQALKNYAEVLAEVASKNPGEAGACHEAIAKAGSNLPPSQQGELVQHLQDKYGNDFAKKVAGDLRAINTKPPTGGFFGDSSFTMTGGPKDSFKMTSTQTGAMGKFIGGVGLGLLLLDAAHETKIIAIKAGEGDYAGAAIEGGLWTAKTAAAFKVGSAAMASFPVITTAAGTFLVAYGATAEVMDYVTYDGKTLNEHVTGAIDDQIFVSEQFDAGAEADLQDLYKEALKSGKYVLPDGMSVADGWQAIQENLASGGPLFDGVLLNNEPPDLDAIAMQELETKQSAWEQAVTDGLLGPDQYEEFLKGYNPLAGTYVGPPLLDLPDPDEDLTEEELTQLVAAAIEKLLSDGTGDETLSAEDLAKLVEAGVKELGGDGTGDEGLTPEQLAKLVESGLEALPPAEVEPEPATPGGNDGGGGPAAAPGGGDPSIVDPNDTALDSIGPWPLLDEDVPPVKDVPPAMSDVEIERIIASGATNDEGMKLYRKTEYWPNGNKRLEYTVWARGPQYNGYDFGWRRNWYEDGTLKSEVYRVTTGTTSHNEGPRNKFYPDGSPDEKGFYKGHEQPSGSSGRMRVTSDKHGEWKQWWKSGKLRCIQHFNLGKKHGPQTWFDEDDGSKTLYTYKDGRQHGREAYWDAEGTITGERIFVNGDVRRVTEFYDDGSEKKVEHRVPNGWLDGPYVTFYRNGQTHELGAYRVPDEGYYHRYGPWKTWDEDGRPLQYGAYNEDGKFTGTSISYYTDEELKGQIAEILVYEDDVIRERTQWTRIDVSRGPDRRYKSGFWVYDAKGKCTAFTGWDRNGKAY